MADTSDERRASHDGEGSARGGDRPLATKHKHNKNPTGELEASPSSDVPQSLLNDPEAREYLKKLQAELAKKDRAFNALREDVHFLATEFRLVNFNNRERERSRSPVRPAESRGRGVKDRLGKRVAPYHKNLPSPSPERSGTRGDPRDRLRPSRSEHHERSLAENEDSLSETASHETAAERHRH